MQAFPSSVMPSLADLAFSTPSATPVVYPIANNWPGALSPGLSLTLPVRFNAFPWPTGMHNSGAWYSEDDAMALRFPADVETSIRDLVSTGRFEDEAQVVREALRLLDRREQQFMDLRSSIQESLAAIERGEGIELTDEVWDRLDREAQEQIACGELSD
jgi:putative addiction module CopG family antidote